VFRTFGVDLDNAIFEFNKFCAGEHPCFNGRNNTPLVKFDGSKNSKDMRFKIPEQKGTIYRGSEEVNDTIMVLGEHERVPLITDVNMIDEDENEVIRDHLEIYQTMLEQLKKNSTMGINEDYPAWKAANFSSSNAKLLLLDQADYNTHHIFFDDNAEKDKECIVDVRDIITGEEIDYEKFINMYVVKVHPHRAITEPEYFIKQIEQAEAKR